MHVVGETVDWTPLIVRTLPIGYRSSMAKVDPVLTEIITRFDRFEVAKGRGGYALLDRRSRAPLARLKPFPQSEKFELFYWSLAAERWRTFGPFGPMKLTLDEIQEIIENEPMFRRTTSLLSLIYAAVLHRIFR